MDLVFIILYILINVWVIYIFSDICYFRRLGIFVFNEEEVSESCFLKLLFNMVNLLLCIEVRY